VLSTHLFLCCMCAVLGGIIPILVQTSTCLHRLLHACLIASCLVGCCMPVELSIGLVSRFHALKAGNVALLRADILSLGQTADSPKQDNLG
jgi:hypothetical protein